MSGSPFAEAESHEPGKFIDAPNVGGGREYDA